MRREYLGLFIYLPVIVRISAKEEGAFLHPLLHMYWNRTGDHVTRFATTYLPKDITSILFIIRMTIRICRHYHCHHNND